MELVLIGACGLAAGFYCGCKITANQFGPAWEALGAEAQKRGRIKISGRWFRITPLTEAFDDEK